MAIAKAVVGLGAPQKEPQTEPQTDMDNFGYFIGGCIESKAEAVQGS